MTLNQPRRVTSTLAALASATALLAMPLGASSNAAPLAAPSSPSDPATSPCPTRIDSAAFASAASLQDLTRQIVGFDCGCRAPPSTT